MIDLTQLAAARKDWNEGLWQPDGTKLIHAAVDALLEADQILWCDIHDKPNVLVYHGHKRCLEYMNVICGPDNATCSQIPKALVDVVPVEKT